MQKREEEPTDIPSLLTLPTELKHEIFSYLLKWEGPICLPRGEGSSRARELHPKHFELFYVCKRLHNDATAYFFEQNMFEIELARPGSISRIRDTMADRHIRQIAQMDLVIWIWRFPGLRRPKLSFRKPDRTELRVGPYVWRLKERELELITPTTPKHIAAGIARRAVVVMIEFNARMTDKRGVDIEFLQYVRDKLRPAILKTPRQSEGRVGVGATTPSYQQMVRSRDCTMIARAAALYFGDWRFVVGCLLFTSFIQMAAMVESQRCGMVIWPSWRRHCMTSPEGVPLKELFG